ncbi:hypothetical protein [Pseudoxanthomonas dokdonensis]|uniref:DUF1232 domain-containing protein n=1 Tax=Pseudoxanthomonas dokdonensis TaxID=344882 RepID=A0A0R0CIK5_9GAMM|nr:hypothetical protein [Pseudoxanthomonas dokdonensis]KRG69046.1 hypothetical protein ABB29_11465 [Pseudoxanthomonas dokdonensis]
MYALNPSQSPLPGILQQMPVDGFHRRRRIGPYLLANARMDHFNDLLARLGRTQAPLDCDQLVTAARQLLDATDSNETPACIVQRIRQVETVARMINDDEWQPEPAAVPVASQLLEYLRSREQLLPAWLPQVGRLDDAIAIDTAWSLLGREAESYRDYLRLRRQQALSRGCDEHALHFDRHDWLAARRIEAEWLARQRQVRDSSYAPASAAMFRVH